jgi:hypothetical protein
LLHPAKLSSTVGGEIKTFHGKQTLRELMITKPALQKILRELFTQKRKINTTMTVWKRINNTRKIDKKIEIRRESTL